MNEETSLLNPIEGDSVMVTTAEQDDLILRTMNLLPSMAREQGKEYAKRITSRIAIDGTITFGIVLPEGGRSDVGTINPLNLSKFDIINAAAELLDVCEQAWEIMQPTAPPSTNTNKEEAMTPAEVKAYMAKIAAEADKAIRREEIDLRELWNTAPRHPYYTDNEEYVDYNGYSVLIPGGVDVLLPEPWYNVLMESKEADRRRGSRWSKMKGLEKSQLDDMLRKGRM